MKTNSCWGLEKRVCRQRKENSRVKHASVCSSCKRAQLPKSSHKSAFSCEGAFIKALAKHFHCHIPTGERLFVFIPSSMKLCVYTNWWEILCLFHLVGNLVFVSTGERLFIPSGEKLCVYTNWWETMLIPSGEKPCVYTNLWETLWLFYLVGNLVFISTGERLFIPSGEKPCVYTNWWETLTQTNMPSTSLKLGVEGEGVLNFEQKFTS